MHDIDMPSLSLVPIGNECLNKFNGRLDEN